MTPEQLAQMQRETRSSIELTRNAKGDYQWVIKVYFEVGEETTAGVTPLERLKLIDTNMRLAYVPRLDGAAV